MFNLSVEQKLILKPSDEELKNYAELAKKSFEEKLFLAQKDIENIPRLSSVTKLPVNQEKIVVDGTTVWGAQFGIASAFIHSWISTNTPLHFDDMDVKFEADVWGVGIGGGVVWLSGWFSKSTGAELLGDVNFIFQTSAIHTEIAFSKDSTPVGGLIGGGLNLQAGYFAGTGSFSKW